MDSLLLQNSAKEPNYFPKASVSEVSTHVQKVNKLAPVGSQLSTAEDLFFHFFPFS